MNFQVSWHADGDKSGSQSGAKALSPNGALTIGRETGVDIVIKDQSISRLHAEIFMQGSDIIVRDRDSANGIRINGQRINKQANWLPGQKVSIGRYVFELIPAMLWTLRVA